MESETLGRPGGEKPWCIVRKGIAGCDRRMERTVQQWLRGGLQPKRNPDPGRDVVCPFLQQPLEL